MNTTLIISTKGGVGKTVTTGNLSTYLAAKGNRVLAIDVDPQASLTSFFGVDKDAINAGTLQSIADVLTIKNYKTENAIQQTSFERLDILPATELLRQANDKILIDRQWVQHTRLKKALVQVADQYDFAIIDSAPSHDMAVSNALVAASNLLVPVCMDDFAFEATEELLSIVGEMKEYNEGLWLVGCFVNMFRPRTTVFEKGLDLLREQKHLKLFDTVVRMGVATNETTFKKEPIFAYAPNSNVSRDFCALFEEYLERCGNHSRGDHD